MIYQTLKALVREMLLRGAYYNIQRRYQPDAWHREYVATIKAGNVDDMVKLLKEHVKGAASAMKEVFEERS